MKPQKILVYHDIREIPTVFRPNTSYTVAAVVVNYVHNV